jgi:hypothetical protein
MTDESQKNFSEKSQRLTISLFIVRIATITVLMAHLSSLCMWRSFSFFVADTNHCVITVLPKGLASDLTEMACFRKQAVNVLVDCLTTAYYHPSAEVALEQTVMTASHCHSFP